MRKIIIFLIIFLLILTKKYSFSSEIDQTMIGGDWRARNGVWLEVLKSGDLLLKNSQYSDLLVGKIKIVFSEDQFGGGGNGLEILLVLKFDINKKSVEQFYRSNNLTLDPDDFSIGPFFTFANFYLAEGSHSMLHFPKLNNYFNTILRTFYCLEKCDFLHLSGDYNDGTWPSGFDSPIDKTK